MPLINKNNHPFVSSDKTLAVAHNGRIEEYRFLRKKYEVKSECDSEILLRILESADNYLLSELNGINHRLAGIRDIFSYIDNGDMAVAVGERSSVGEHKLWLFRNEGRPLWIIDLRDTLGQIFFISDPFIWEESIKNLPRFKKEQKLIEILPEEIWEIDVNLNFQKFKVEKSNSSLWNFDGKMNKIRNLTPQCEVISSLNKFDEIKPREGKKKIIENLSQEMTDLINNILDISLISKDRELQEIIDSLNHAKLSLEDGSLI